MKKTCGICGLAFPATLNHFFVRNARTILASGKVVTYTFLRSNCKSCCGKRTLKRQREKRAMDLKMSVPEYLANNRAITISRRWDGKRKHSDIKKLACSIGEKRTIMSKIAAGYKFTTYAQYKKDAKAWLAESLRSNGKNKSLPAQYLLKKDAPREVVKRLNRSLNDAQITNWLGGKVGDFSQEVIKTKRLLVLINDEIKAQLNP